MAITRAKKEKIVEKYIDSLNDSDAIIFTEYSGMTVNELEELRGHIREAEGSFIVMKNTLARRALEEAGLPIPEDMMMGPVAIGFCHKNIPGVAKAITKFAKDNDLFNVKGGLLGEQVVDDQAIKDLADMPPLEEFRAKILGLLNAPASQLVGVTQGSVRQVVNVINAAGAQQLLNVLNAKVQQDQAAEA